MNGIKWGKRKPRYCSKSGRKLFLYWCFSCRKFHRTFWILRDCINDETMPFDRKHFLAKGLVGGRILNEGKIK